MKTHAVRLHGASDLRLDSFDLPAIHESEILVRIISDSVCMSSYKASIQGAGHKRVPDDVAENPIIIGHECAGEIVQVGSRWQHRFASGSRFALQPAMNRPGRYEAPGYSYPYCGGAATYAILPPEIMEHDCLLSYSGEGFFNASLAEPVSCIVGAYNASYHTSPGSYEHAMGIVEGGTMAILAGCGPMGLAAIDYALHGPRRPSRLVVVDIDNARLARAQSLLPPEQAAKIGIALSYHNTSSMENAARTLRDLSGGDGFNDVFVFAPLGPVIELGDEVLGADGCLNFFAGPTDPTFKASFNFYNVHYGATHIVGTSGGNTSDMLQALRLMEAGVITPAVMVTHIGGLTCAAETTLNLPSIPGGKKLIYTGIDMPLIALDELGNREHALPIESVLANIVKKNNGLWSAEAEQILLEKGRRIEG